jgi:hypothetical protein
VTRLAPIAGGCDVPFEPSPEDWAEYHRMMDLADRFDAMNDDRASESPA